MGCKAFLYELFLPKGYPSSVADEYWDYQIWDTMQQVTYFVNTVISSQAIMKFHGVGNVKATPAEATALSVSRDALAESVSLLARVPAMTQRYKTKVAPFRLLSEILNACGHLMEILASIVQHAAFLLYGGPMVCNISGAMSGATRARIMQHFAKQGNNGDVSLKESNQDKGGKILGVLVGVILLSFLAGGRGVDENTVLHRSLVMFCCLSVLHIFGNIKAVQVLRVPAQQPSVVVADAKKPEAGALSCMKAMFLPPGYPSSVAPTYTRYQILAAVRSLLVYPESVVMNMAFWHFVYGVGNKNSTPMQAVMINIFQVTVSAIVGLISGLPAVTRRFDYSAPVWKLRSGILGSIGCVLKFLAALLPKTLDASSDMEIAGQPPLFFVLIVCSVCISAFAGTSGSMTNANIAKNWSRSDQVGLVDISVTGSNQVIVSKLTAAIVCVAYLYGPGSEGDIPLETSLVIYGVITIIDMLTVYGQYLNMPDEPPEVAALHTAGVTLPLLLKTEDAPALKRSVSDFAEAIDIDATTPTSQNMYTPSRNT